MHLAQRIRDLPPYVFAGVVRRIREKEARGERVINLGIGSPDMPPPDFVVDAMVHAARDPTNHRYPGYVGSPELRRAIAAYYRRRFGVELDPEREVLPLIGSKEGLAHVMWALVDPGDLVLVPDPGYPTYRLGVYLAGGEVHFLPLRAQNDFLPDLEAVPEAVYRRAVAVWVNYPHNPTGAVAPLDFYRRLVELAREYDFVVLSDNPYADVTFDDYRAPSFLEVEGAREVGIEFNSLSKTYNMAGWRVGMAVGNANLIGALTRVKSNVDTGIFLPLQVGAVAVLEGPQDWIAERNAVYQERRDVLVAGLRKLGFVCQTPRATLYVWARVPEGWTSEALSNYLLDRAGVWVTPGTFFGPSGEGFVRVAFTVDVQVIQEALDRMERALSRPETRSVEGTV